MIEQYEIENIEQLRAIADMLRLRIIDILQKQPMTVTQLGETLGLAPAKVHYHVRELERAGLLRMVETREKGGILEKYYQPIARYIGVERTLLSAPPDEAMATISGLLGQVSNNFLSALRKELEQRGERHETKATHSLSLTRLFIRNDELKELFKQMGELFKPFESSRGIDGELEILAMTLTYPEGQSASSSETSSPLPVRQLDAEQIVGVVRYDRAELEKMVAEGKRLDITVVGVCQFADDVSVELAERAVEHLNVIGKLFASPEVREVLLKKRSD
jgi:DNA-binding transcriptional ArsR family regulator